MGWIQNWKDRKLEKNQQRVRSFATLLEQELKVEEAENQRLIQRIEALKNAKDLAQIIEALQGFKIELLRHKKEENKEHRFRAIFEMALKKQLKPFRKQLAA
jgi:hypothetical protein